MKNKFSQQIPALGRNLLSYSVSCLLLTLCCPCAHAFQVHIFWHALYHQWYDGCCDSIQVTYSAQLAKDNLIQPGSYYVNVLVDSVPAGKLTVTVNADRSVTTSGLGPSGFGTQHPRTVRISSDGNLYRQADLSPESIVGAVGGGLSFCWVPSSPYLGYCSDGLTWDVFYLNCLFTISPPSCGDSGAGGSAGDPGVGGSAAGGADGLAPGQDKIALNSLHAAFGLGVGTNYQGRGQLSIDAQVSTTNLATPTALAVYSSGKLSSVSDSNGLRQVLSGDVLADIVVAGPFQYDIRFYPVAQAGVTNGSGLYVPTGNPFKVTTVQNPDASTNVYSRLWITTVEGDATNRFQYSYTNSGVYTDYWELLYPSNLKRGIAHHDVIVELAYKNLGS